MIRVLNNFYASYFVGSLLIPRNELSRKLQGIFESKEFNKSDFTDVIHHYNASPETFFYRLTNILPKDFNLQNLFFIRLSHKKGGKKYHIEKELHLINNQSSNISNTSAYYSRRWVSVNALNLYLKAPTEANFDLQILHDPNRDKRYLVFSFVVEEAFKEGYLKSIHLGLLINKQLEKRFLFLGDPSLSRENISNVSKDYKIFDSQNRIAKPVILEQQDKNKAIESVVEEITKLYS